MKFLILLVLSQWAFLALAASPPVGVQPNDSDWNAWLDRKPNSIGFLNRLILSESPYLLQHAENPINWQGWPIPKQGDRLLFISIGYASCHWCHQMNEHTFMNESLAKSLNEEFVSIKVDRDEYPEVDYHYLQIQQQVLSEGGWPISIVALPDGSPVWMGSFEDAQGLEKIVRRLSHIWKIQPTLLEAQAENIKALSKADEIRVASNLDFKSFFIKNRDLIHGGNLGDVKFPMEGDLLYMLDKYSAGDHSLKKVLVQHLNSLAGSPLHDGVGGGFYRYATEKDWSVPHFEKMLYTQAQLLAIYSEAFKVLKDPVYLSVASRIFNFMQASMLRNDGFYKTSINADWQGIEGGYYLWDRSTLDQLDIKQNILNAGKAGWQYHGLKFQPDLMKLQQQREEPVADSRGFTGLNGLVLWALSKASKVNLPGSQLAMESLSEKLIAERILDDKVVRICYVSKDCLKAQVDDLAYLALGLAEVSVFNEPAKLAANLVLKTLFVNLNSKDKFTHQDHESISPLTAALKAAFILKKSVPYDWLFLKYQGVAASFFGARDKYLDAFKISNIAKGHGLVLQFYNEETRQISLVLEAGWHVNSNKPVQDYLISTKIIGGGIGVHYPEGSLKKMGFSEKPLSLYEGKVDITIQNIDDISKKNRLRLQACNDRSCLPPETIELL